MKKSLYIVSGLVLLCLVMFLPAVPVSVEKLSPNIIFKYFRIGGVAGFNDEISIDNSGNLYQKDKVVRMLNKKDLESLKDYISSNKYVAVSKNVSLYTKLFVNPDSIKPQYPDSLYMHIKVSDGDKTVEINTDEFINTLLFKNQVYEIGGTYNMKWRNEYGEMPSSIAVEMISSDDQNYGYQTIATSSLGNAIDGNIDIQIPTNLNPKYDYRLVVFGKDRSFIYKAEDTFSVVDNRSLSEIIPGGKLISVDKAHIFEFGKPFTVSGHIVAGASSAIVYSSGVELAKNFAQVSIEKFSLDACEVLSANDSNSICSVKGERAVTLKINAVISDDTSYWLTTRIKSLTLVGSRVSRLERRGNNYEIELVSMDIQKKEATIIIRPVSL